MSQHKEDEPNKKPEVKDLDPQKDPKAGGGFKPASPGGGPKSTDPVPPAGS